MSLTLVQHWMFLRDFIAARLRLLQSGCKTCNSSQISMIVDRMFWHLPQLWPTARSYVVTFHKSTCTSSDLFSGVHHVTIPCPRSTAQARFVLPISSRSVLRLSRHRRRIADDCVRQLQGMVPSGVRSRTGCACSKRRMAVPCLFWLIVVVMHCWFTVSIKFIAVNVWLSLAILTCWTLFLCWLGVTCTCFTCHYFSSLL